MPELPHTDIYNKVKNLNLPPASTVVVGEAAVEALVGSEKYRAGKIEVVASQPVFDELWRQQTYQRHTASDGSRSVSREDVTVTATWNGRDSTMLAQRGYQNQGTNIAGAPDVRRKYQNEGTRQGDDILTVVRNRLYSSDVLPPQVIAQEMEFVKNCMPPHLRERPELAVAANGLYIVRSMFGSREDGARWIVPGKGVVEPHQHTYYHGYEHSAEGLPVGQRKIRLVNAEAKAAGTSAVFDDDDTVVAPIAFANHDRDLGGGRQRQNPTGYDELKSADGTAKQLEKFDVSDKFIENTHSSILATAFNEETKAQNVRLNGPAPHLQALTAETDVSLKFQDPLGKCVSQALDLGVEDLTRTGAGYDAPLTRLLNHLNENRPPGTPPITIEDPADAHRLIDENPDFPASRTVGGVTENMTIKDALIKHAQGSSGFMKGHKPTGKWQQDTTTPKKNAEDMQNIADRAKADEKLADLYQERLIQEAKNALNHALNSLPNAQLEAALIALGEAKHEYAQLLASSSDPAAQQINGNIEAALGAIDSAKNAINNMADQIQTIRDRY